MPRCGPALLAHGGEGLLILIFESNRRRGRSLTYASRDAMDGALANGELLLLKMTQKG
jgi:hypothetical protein